MNTYRFIKDYTKWKPSTKRLTVSNIAYKPSTKMLNTKETNTKEKYISSFDTFWCAYPKKVDKKKSKEIWLKKIQPQNGKFNEIMQALNKAKESVDWLKNDGQFIPYPSTWLRNERWEDEEQNIASRPNKVAL